MPWALSSSDCSRSFACRQTSGAVDSYQVVGTSKSGNHFTITKTAGNFVKPYTCDTGAKAGCGTGGKW